ncbi:MAG: choice-of-anchor E domain-containing protein [Phycisphaerae bacterium]|nr:choice-of-anchor E domain-containing protein [Phycisphaerae bacterium]
MGRHSGRLVLGAALASIVAVGAHGGTTEAEEVHRLAFDFPLAPGMQVIPISKFDERGGSRRLLQVTLLLDAAVSADVTAENDAPDPAPEFALSLSGFVTSAFGSVETVTGVSETFETDGVAGSDGVTGSGPDFWDFGTVIAIVVDMDTTLTALDGFIGTGLLDAEVFASGGFVITSATDSTLTFNDFRAAGTVSVIYRHEVLFTEGGCCFDDGSCTYVFETECLAAGGSFQGELVECVSAACPQPGACCFPDGTCDEDFASTCGNEGGVYQGAGTTCVGDPCPPPVGACCLGDGTCQETTIEECDTLAGTYAGNQVLCADADCPPAGACCFGDGVCTFMLVDLCESGGVSSEATGSSATRSNVPPSARAATATAPARSCSRKIASTSAGSTRARTWRAKACRARSSARAASPAGVCRSPVRSATPAAESTSAI